MDLYFTFSRWLMSNPNSKPPKINETIVSCSFNHKECDMDFVSLKSNNYFANCLRVRVKGKQENKGVLNGLHIDVLLDSTNKGNTWINFVKLQLI